MTNLTIEMVEAMGYKELQATAKTFGIKANQKKEALVVRICANIIADKYESKENEDDEFEQFANGEVPELESASEASAPVELDYAVKNFTYIPYTFAWDEEEAPEENLIQPADPLPGQATYMKIIDTLIADANPIQPKNTVSASATTKVFEFIRSNNLGVVFMQKGVEVKIGWDPSDARPYIQVGEQPKRLMMIQSAIDRFKPFNNGVHGDVARIVKALVRIKKMPAQVLVQQQQRRREAKAANGVSGVTNQQRQQQNVSAADRKENPSKARYSGTIDASWLAQFRTEFETNEGRKPTGLEIRDAWLNRGA